jgi:hypothetical protein
VRLRHVARVGGLALTAVAAITMLAACGGSSKPPAASTAASGGNNGIQAYVSCLNQHGVTIALPSRSPGAGGARPSRSPGAPRPSRSPGAPRPSRSPGAGGFGGGGFGGGGFGGGGFAGGGLGGGIFNDPSHPPTGVSTSAWTAALAACKSLAPTFNRSGGGGASGNSQYTAYLNCLKSHGVTASGGQGSFNTADPKVAAAMKTCAPLRPTSRPGGAPTSTG